MVIFCQRSGVCTHTFADLAHMPSCTCILAHLQGSLSHSLQNPVIHLLSSVWCQGMNLKVLRLRKLRHTRTPYAHSSMLSTSCKSNSVTLCVCVCMHACARACVHVCVCACVCILHVRLYIYVYACECTCSPQLTAYCRSLQL